MNRLTIVETIYHSEDTGPPVICEHRQTKILTSGEQPFVRKFDVPDTWIPLPLSWMEGLPTSVIHLTNVRPSHNVIPTPAQLLDESTHIIDIAIQGSPLANLGESPVPVLYIPPGDAVRLITSGRILLKCRVGTTKVSAFIYPT